MKKKPIYEVLSEKELFERRDFHAIFYITSRVLFVGGYETERGKAVESLRAAIKRNDPAAFDIFRATTAAYAPSRFRNLPETLKPLKRAFLSDMRDIPVALLSAHADSMRGRTPETSSALNILKGCGVDGPLLVDAYALVGTYGSPENFAAIVRKRVSETVSKEITIVRMEALARRMSAAFERGTERILETNPDMFVSLVEEIIPRDNRYSGAIEDSITRPKNYRTRIAEVAKNLSDAELETAAHRIFLKSNFDKKTSAAHVKTAKEVISRFSPVSGADLNTTTGRKKALERAAATLLTRGGDIPKELFAAAMRGTSGKSFEDIFGVGARVLFSKNPENAGFLLESVVAECASSSMYPLLIESLSGAGKLLFESVVPSDMERILALAARKLTPGTGIELFKLVARLSPYEPERFFYDALASVRKNKSGIKLVTDAVLSAVETDPLYDGDYDRKEPASSAAAKNIVKKIGLKNILNFICSPDFSFDHYRPGPNPVAAFLRDADPEETEAYLKTKKTESESAEKPERLRADKVKFMERLEAASVLRGLTRGIQPEDGPFYARTWGYVPACAFVPKETASAARFCLASGTDPSAERTARTVKLIESAVREKELSSGEAVRFLEKYVSSKRPEPKPGKKTAEDLIAAIALSGAAKPEENTDFEISV